MIEFVGFARLLLQGLLREVDYDITEPAPNSVTQSTGNSRIVETDCPSYQLGYASVILSGDILMHAGLPIKFYTSDDCVLFRVRAIEIK